MEECKPQDHLHADALHHQVAYGSTALLVSIESAVAMASLIYQSSDSLEMLKDNAKSFAKSDAWNW